MVMSYSGWSNYETWCLNQWIENEEGSYHYWQERTAEIAEDSNHPRADLADALKEEVEELAPPLEGMFADLMSAAIGKIDFHEIAEAWLENYQEESKAS